MQERLLDEAIEAWRDARGLVRGEAHNISTKDYGFRPAPGVRSVAELLVHILEVSEMMVGELCRPDGDFQRAPFPQLIATYGVPVAGLQEKDEIVAALDRTLEKGVGAFHDVGQVHMLQPIRQFDGTQASRLSWMHHGIAQEMYHGGQLALYTRIMGGVPALTKKIRGDD